VYNNLFVFFIYTCGFFYSLIRPRRLLTTSCSFRKVNINKRKPLIFHYYSGTGLIYRSVRVLSTISVGCRDERATREIFPAATTLRTSSCYGVKLQGRRNNFIDEFRVGSARPYSRYVVVYRRPKRDGNIRVFNMYTTYMLCISRLNVPRLYCVQSYSRSRDISRDPKDLCAWRRPESFSLHTYKQYAHV